MINFPNILEDIAKNRGLRVSITPTMIPNMPYSTGSCTSKNRNLFFEMKKMGDDILLSVTFEGLNAALMQAILQKRGNAVRPSLKKATYILRQQKWVDLISGMKFDHTELANRWCDELL